MKRSMVKRWSCRSAGLIFIFCLLAGSLVVGIVTASGSSGGGGGSSGGSSEVTFSGSSLFTDWQKRVATNDQLDKAALERLKKRARALQFEFQEDKENQELWEAYWYERHSNNPGTSVYTVYVTMPSNELSRTDIRDIGGMLFSRYAEQEARKQKFLRLAAELYEFPGTEFIFVELDSRMNLMSANTVAATTPQEFVQYLTDPRFNLQNPYDYNPYSDAGADGP